MAVVPPHTLPPLCFTAFVVPMPRSSFDPTLPKAGQRPRAPTPSSSFMSFASSCSSSFASVATLCPSPQAPDAKAFVLLSRQGSTSTVGPKVALGLARGASGSRFVEHLSGPPESPAKRPAATLRPKTKSYMGTFKVFWSKAWAAVARALRFT